MATNFETYFDQIYQLMQDNTYSLCEAIQQIDESVENDMDALDWMSQKTYQITTFEKELLELYSNTYKYIARGELSENINFYRATALSPIVRQEYNDMFAFIDNGEKLSISEILEEAEVKDNE